MATKQDSEFINLVIKKLGEKVKDRIEAGRNMMGEHPGQERVSRYMQLKAYKEMTAQDLTQLASQKGPQEFAKYVLDMERARRGKGAE